MNWDFLGLGLGLGLGVVCLIARRLGFFGFRR